MGVEEDVKDLFEGDFGWVEFDLDDLSVTGQSCTDFLVGWIFSETTSVATDDFFDAFEFEEHGFCAPEATSAERSEFGFGRLGLGTGG